MLLFEICEDGFSGLELGGQEHAAEVNGNYPVPLLLSDLACCYDRLSNAGVVKCRVQSPESFDSLVQRRLRINGLCDVTADHECAAVLLCDQRMWRPTSESGVSLFSLVVVCSY